MRRAEISITYAAVNNCTIIGNSGSAEGFNSGLSCYYSAAPVVTDTIFYGNSPYGIRGFGSEAAPALDSCLFHDNMDPGFLSGDYFDDDTDEVLTGAEAINALPGCENNVDGDPAFIAGPTGTWTSDPDYDADTNRTTLTDSLASFVPGALEGLPINPNTSQTLQSVIVANTTTTVTVLGDVSSYAEDGDSYSVFDYHLSYGSAAIDAGTDSGLDTDIDGDSRPQGDSYDVGADERVPLPITKWVQFGFSRFETEDYSLYPHIEPVPPQYSRAVQVRVVRTGDVSSTCSVEYTTQDVVPPKEGGAGANDDYLPTSGTLEFNPSDTVKYFSVCFLDDTEVETSESLRLILRNPSEGTALGTVCDVPFYIQDVPPDPADLPATVTAGSVPNSVYDDTWNWYGPDNVSTLVQRCVPEGAIVRDRAAAVWGTLYEEDETTTYPVVGVTVRVLDHPEFGYTLTRPNGRYDMVVNALDGLTLTFEKAGYLRSQRRLTTMMPGAYNVVPDVKLVVPGEIYHRIDLTGIPSSQSFVLTEPLYDEEAETTRTGLLFVQPGTTALLVYPELDGESRTETLTSFTLYTTEFTVAPDDTPAMPAELDSAVAYTYCLEYSVLESEARGASMVYLQNTPASYYIENFLSFPIGTIVPSGSYFRDPVRLPDNNHVDGGSWVPEENGRVIRVHDIVTTASPPIAVLEVIDENEIADENVLAAFGISQSELAFIAQRYGVGETFWRVRLRHFTFPCDFNWPFYSRFGRMPSALPPYVGIGGDWWDSILGAIWGIFGFGEVNSIQQVFQESISLPGTPLSLNYSSRRADGFKYGRDIIVPLYVGDAPSDLLRVDIRLSVAGRKIDQSYEQAQLAQDLKAVFRWDGLNRAGQVCGGYQKASVAILYTFPYDYGTPDDYEAMGTSFGQPSDPDSYSSGSLRPIRGETYFDYRTYTLSIPPYEKGSTNWYSMRQGIGGWTLSNHHAYDPALKKVLLGTGDEYDAEPMDMNVHSVIYSAGYGDLDVQAICADRGNLYVGAVQESLFYPYTNYVFALHRPDGVIREARLIAGTDGFDKTYPPGTPARKGAYVDGWDPLMVDLNNICDLATGPGGTLYIATDEFVYKMSSKVEFSPSGERPTKIWHVAGSRTGVEPEYNHTNLLNGIDARTINFGTGSIAKIAVGCNGFLYILQSCPPVNNSAIYRVDGSGKTWLIANSAPAQSTSPIVDGSLAVNARFRATDIDVDSDGSVHFIGASNKRIYRVTPDGLVHWVAGNGSYPTPYTTFDQFFGSAKEVPMAPISLSLDKNGAMAIGAFQSSQYGTRIHSVNSAGYAGLLAGIGGGPAFQSRPSPALSAYIGRPISLAADDKGNTYYLGRAPGASCEWSFIGRISPTRCDIADDGYVIPSQSGDELFVFDGQGRHLKTWDANTGACICEFEYDDAGRLVREEDAFGNDIEIHRDANGLPYEIVAPFGQTTDLETSGGLLVRTVKPGGRTTTLEYGPGGVLQTITGPRNNAYSVEYDDYGLTTQVRDPLGGGYSLERSGMYLGNTLAGHKVTMTSALGVTNSIGKTKTSSGIVEYTATASDGTQIKNIFHPAGVEEIRDSNGTSTTIRMMPDPRYGMVVPFNSSVRTKAAGIVSEEIASLEVEDFQMEEGLFTFTETFAETLDGRPATTTLRRLDGTEPLWESVHKTTLGRTVRAVFDRFGQTTRLETPGVPAIEYEYDSHGRIHTISQGSGVAERSMTSAYNGAGLLETVTDSLGRQVSYEYDGCDFLTTTTLPGGGRIARAYDAGGNLVSFSPPGRQAYVFNYNLRGEQTRSETPDPGSGALVTTVTLNLDRQLTAMTLPDGGVIHYRYESGVGRLCEIETPEGRFLRTDYYANTGQVKSEGDGATTYTYSYYGGPLVGLSIASPAGEASMAMTYGASFRPETLTLNASGTIHALDFDYNDDDQVTRVGLAEIVYDAQTGWHTLTSVSSGGHDVSSANADFTDFGEVATCRVARDGLTTYSAENTFDLLGRITEQSETVSGVALERAYEYDERGFLTVARRDDKTTTYTYDANGNRLSRVSSIPGQGAEYGSYNSLDQCEEYGGYSYAYNARGQLYSKTGLGGTTTYEYDSLGNLTSVTLPTTPATVIEYVVDGAGRRIGRKVDGAWTNRWVYGAGLGPIAELDWAGRISRRYVYVDHPNVPNYMVEYAYANETATTPETETVWAYVLDQRGSVRKVVRISDGYVAESHEYDEYGRLVGGDGFAWQPFGFAGGLADDDTHLIRFGARDYDPHTGRWTAPDPIGFAGGTNLYGYVLADPVNLKDALGFGPEGPGEGDWQEWFYGFNIGAGYGLLGFANRILGQEWGDPTNDLQQLGFAIGDVTLTIEEVLGFAELGIGLGRGMCGLVKAAKNAGGAAETGYNVYLGMKNGEAVYAGATNNLARRAAEHGARFDYLQEVASGLARNEARGMEQALIEAHRGVFQNIRNSISPKNPIYNDAVSAGRAWLKAHGWQ